MRKTLLTISLLLTLLLTGCIQPSANTDAKTTIDRFTKIAFDIQSGEETDIEAVCDGYFIDELYDECVALMNDIPTDGLLEYTFTISNVNEIELTDQEMVDLGLSNYEEAYHVTFDMEYDFTTSSNQQFNDTDTTTIVMVVVNGIYFYAELD